MSKHQKLSIEELTERFYAVKSQRDKLLWRMSRIADMAEDDLRRGVPSPMSCVFQIEADARATCDEVRGALAEIHEPHETLRRILAWCDRSDSTPDQQALFEIENLCRKTLGLDALSRPDAIDRQSYKDLAVSGGIVDAP